MRGILWPLGFLFYLIATLRVWLFQKGFLSSKKVSKPVLAVGNISTGGTGKTPWVQKLTEYFKTKGHSVVLLSRGYSGDFSGVLKVESSMDPRKCGDEPLWLERITKAPVYVGKNRHQAAEQALKSEDVDLFILDDAFQHMKLQRDLNLVLIDASVPRWHYRPLPVGYLREGFSSLHRSQIVVLNKCNYASAEDVEWLRRRCGSYVPEDRIFYSDFTFSNWQPLINELESGTMPSSPLAMTCGIGNPKAFEKTLADQGLKPVRKFIFPDHYYWKPEDIERMTFNMKVEDCRDLLMTEKDAVKLSRYYKHFLEMGIQLWVCKMQVKLKEREDIFWGKLEEILSLS